MTLYKLTDAEMRTYHGYQWALGEERVAPGGGPLCTDRWLHAYADPLVAVLMDPVHGKYITRDGARMFEAEGTVGAIEPDGKVGCTSLTLQREIPLPAVTPEQRLRYGILCALAVYTDDSAWSAWASAWLSGEDRSWVSAKKAKLHVPALTERAAAAMWAAAAVGYQAAATVARAAEASAWSRPIVLDLAVLARRAVEDRP